MKFQILAGKHHAHPKLPNGQIGHQVWRARLPSDPPEYHGDIIETDVDLCKQFNHRGMPQKFVQVYENTQYQSYQPPAVPVGPPPQSTQQPANVPQPPAEEPQQPVAQQAQGHSQGNQGKQQNRK